MTHCVMLVNFSLFPKAAANLREKWRKIVPKIVRKTPRRAVRETIFFYSRFGHKDDRLLLCGKPSVLHAVTISNRLLLFVATIYVRFFRWRHIAGLIKSKSIFVLF